MSDGKKNMEARVGSFIDSVRRNVANEIYDIIDDDRDDMNSRNNVSSPRLEKKVMQSGVVMNLGSNRSRVRIDDVTRKPISASQKKRKINLYDFRKKNQYTMDGMIVRANEKGGVQIVTPSARFSDQSNDLNQKPNPDNNPIEKSEGSDSITYSESESSDAMTENIQKDETDILSDLTENIEIHTSSISRDLNIEQSIKLIMSEKNQANQQPQEAAAYIKTLRTLQWSEKSLQTISNLTENDKLWLEDREFDVGVGEKETKKVLILHVGGNSYTAALSRTWYGQGRKDILNHIEEIVDTVEEQTKWNQLGAKQFTSAYAARIGLAAEKLNKVLAITYKDHKSDIKKYAKRLLAAKTLFEDMIRDCQQTPR